MLKESAKTNSNGQNQLLNSSVTLDFGGFESVLFNTPGQQNATINNIPPDLNVRGDQKNSIKLSFDEDMGD